MKNNYVMWMCESAIMIAAATVLSFIAVIKMPFGGSVTALSMVPILLVAFRYGVKKGLVTGLVYGVIQLLFDTGTLSYATSKWAVLAIILLDYVLAFGVLGLSAMFKGKAPNSIVAGSIVAICLRFIMHVISGCTVWAGLSIPTGDALVYSLGYNAAYMLPELIVSVAGIYYLSRVLDLKSEKLTRKRSENSSSMVYNAIGALSLLIVAVFDALKLFSIIQTSEGYNIQNLISANYTSVIIVSALGVVLALVMFLLNRSKSK